VSVCMCVCVSVCVCECVYNRVREREKEEANPDHDNGTRYSEENVTEMMLLVFIAAVQLRVTNAAGTNGRAPLLLCTRARLRGERGVIRARTRSYRCSSRFVLHQIHVSQYLYPHQHGYLCLK